MSETVLIVDDSMTVRMDLVEAFSGAGFRPLPCATVAEARHALASEHVDLAVLDVVLPDGNGIDLLREIHQAAATAGLPVLLLSSEAEVRDRIRGLETGAADYVGKPYERGYVLARARELVGRRRRPHSHPATVLLIDDSRTLREEVGRALAGSGYAVLTAETGEDGLRLAAEARPAAIVVDGVLPGIDGATVVRRIRLDAVLRGTPCLLLTGSEDQRDELRALDSGADGFVRKEEGVAVILARLGAVLRSAGGSFGPSAGAATASLLGPKRLLAVDDSPTFLHEIGTQLRSEGYDVVLAASGEEALDMLTAQPVDCVLLDLLMPGIGGKETCRRIKADPRLRDIPLIILTALEDQQAVIEGLATGADDYLSKTGDFEVLRARVRAQLRRRQFEQENQRFRDELLHKELEAAEARAARDLAETRAVLVTELERKNQELEAFSYSVSHDLRAPLRSIDGYSQALLEDCAASLDDTGRHYLARVRAGAQRMGELIDDLLKLSRVGRAELHRSRVDLSELARAILEELGRRDPTRKVNAAIAGGLPAWADRRLLRVVLENLLGNAWKFTVHSPAARIEVGADSATFFVRDNGVGFDPTYTEKLFRPFQRLHDQADFPGTGIGLATVHRIIDRHGGRVWAESSPGAGATFYFTLPPSEGSDR